MCEPSTGKGLYTTVPRLGKGGLRVPAAIGEFHVLGILQLQLQLQLQLPSQGIMGFELLMLLEYLGAWFQGM